MRASRLISILLLLQNRGRMTAQELATELEVSVRTVYRDVESLSASGVPIYADRGPAGGYQLLEGYRTRLTGLTPAEAEALFLTGMPGPAAELGLSEGMAGAQLKLLAALPQELRSRADRIRERFHLDVQGWLRDPDAVPHLAPLAEAVWTQRVIRVTYQRPTRSSPIVRTLEPLGLVLSGGSWYLVARPASEDGSTEPATAAGPANPLRTYRVTRIQALELLDRHFERGEELDLGAHWQAQKARFQSYIHRGDATVRLSPRAVEMLPYLNAPAILRAAQSAAPPDDDGWVQVVVPIESIDYTHRELLRLGVDAEVLAPPELRRRMAETVAALARRYEDRNNGE